MQQREGGRAEGANQQRFDRELRAQQRLGAMATARKPTIIAAAVRS